MKHLTRWLAALMVAFCLSAPLAAQTVSQDSARAKVAADSIIRISTSSRVDRLAAELKLIVNRIVAAVRALAPPPPPPPPVPPPVPPPAGIVAVPTTLTFAWTIGTPLPPEQTITVTTPGAVTWTHSEASPFLGVEPCRLGTGFICASGTVARVVLAPPAWFTTATVGTYTGTVTIQAGTLTLAVPVTLIISTAAPSLQVQAFWTDFSSPTFATDADSVELCNFFRFADGVVATSTNARVGGCAAKLTTYQAGRVPALSQQALADTACTGFTLATILGVVSQIERVRVMGTRSCRAYVYAR